MLYNNRSHLSPSPLHFPLEQLTQSRWVVAVETEIVCQSRLWCRVAKRERERGGREREREQSGGKLGKQLYLHFFNLPFFSACAIFCGRLFLERTVIVIQLRRRRRLRLRLRQRCDYFLVKFCGLKLCKSRVCLGSLKTRACSPLLPPPPTDTQNCAAG